MVKDLGERNLLGSLLLLAVQDYLGQRKKLPNERRDPADDAERYLFNNDREYVLSFLNVCEVLRIDPEGMRRELKRRKLTMSKPQGRAQTVFQLFRVSSQSRESGHPMALHH
jgi:hypothetical protein